MPLLEAFKGWTETDMGEFFVQLGLTLCVKRGQEGIEVMQDACQMIYDTLQIRSMRKATAN